MLIEYVKSIKAKEFSASDGVKKFIDKIKVDKHNAVIEIFEDSALSQAKAVDSKIKEGKPLGRLAGAPILIKDIMLYKGHKAGAASKMLENFVSPYTATVVQKLIDEDAIILGRTNMDEFAMGTTGETSARGVALNAMNSDYVAGGSSSGAAAAVGAELCVAALGSDTGGSVRVPAAFNGLYGIKPTYGTVSRYGIIAFASSLEQAGPICRTAADTELLLDVISGKDPFDGTTIDIQPFKKTGANITIGYVKEVWGHKENIKYYDKYQKLFEWFKSQGATIKEISIPNFELSLPTYYIIAPAEAASNLARFDGVKYTTAPQDIKNIDELYKRTRTENFGNEVKRRINLGNYVLSSGYFDAYYGKAKKLQSALTKTFEKAFTQCDVIILPTSNAEAPKVGQKMTAVEMYLIDLFTVAANITGMPALSVPFDVGEAGLPIGFQIMGTHFSEPILFDIAKKFEVKHD